MARETDIMNSIPTKATAGLPEWLLTTENYVPQHDREHYLRGSLLKLTGVLSHVRSGGQSSATTWSAPACLLLAIELIVLLSLARNMLFVYVLLGVVLVRLCLLPEQLLRRVTLPALTAGLATAVLLLPAALYGTPHTLTVVTLKVFLSVGIISMYSALFPWSRITAGLRKLHMPAVAVMILDVALKYTVVLGDIATEMLEALELRAVGKNRKKQASVSGIVGVLFLKSASCSRELSEAMECRGFTGEYLETATEQSTLKRLAVLLAMLAAAAVFIFLEEAL